jgi:hypothetical protein
MIQQVFTRGDVSQELDHFTTLYVDEGRGRHLFRKYRIVMMPMFVILSPDGEEMGRFHGDLRGNQFRHCLEYCCRMKKLDKLLNESPEDPWLWKERGDLMFGRFSFNKAVEAWSHARRFDVGNKLKIRADIQFARMVDTGWEHLNRLEPKLDRFVRDFPNSPRVADTLFFKGLIARDAGDTIELRALGGLFDPGHP